MDDGEEVEGVAKGDGGRDEPTTWLGMREISIRAKK